MKQKLYPSIKDVDGYSNIAQFVKPAGNYLMLAIGSKYDPVCYKADGSIDCSNPSCSQDASCTAKQDKPSVQAFVMSYCPYGTQIEKGLLPVLNLLGNKVDYSIKFVDYSMHGNQELTENMRQYCIQTNNKDKYLSYMQCFLTAGKSDDCVKQVGLDAAKLNTCINQTDAQYKILATAGDKSKWNGASYPPFPIDAADNTKYGVQGSPSFVLNGKLISNQARDPQSLLDAICAGFNTKPPECSQKLSTSAPTAGFGFGNSTAAASSSGGCASA